MNFPAQSKVTTWGFSAGTIPRVRAGMRVARILAIGLAITGLQVVAVLAVAAIAGARTPAEAYESLCRWDGKIYLHIAAHGYRTTVPPTSYDLERSNVAFFPGYPLAGRWMFAAAGGAISIEAALVLTAQLAAWGFWSYWLLFLARWRVPWQAASIATLAIALHPAAYFLVIAYSESLFLFGLLGFLYWVGGTRRRYWPLAAVHGAVITATRLGGLPVAFCPLLAQLLVDVAAHRTTAIHAIGRLRFPFRSLGGLAPVCAAASLGGLAFFAYCQWQYGAWDIYMQAQQAGWKVSADWGWWLQPLNYVFIASLWHPNVVWPDDLSRFCVVATMILFAAVGRFEMLLAKTGVSGWQARLVFYLAALALFVLHASGASSILMKSMIRYSLPVHVLVLLAVLELSSRWPVASWLSRRRVGWLAVALAVLAALQTAMAWRFFCDQWAA
jgi:hypothetical protein